MQCFQLNPQYRYGIATEITASSLPRTRTRSGAASGLGRAHTVSKPKQTYTRACGGFRFPRGRPPTDSCSDCLGTALEAAGAGLGDCAVVDGYLAAFHGEAVAVGVLEEASATGG
jgi:hypothetical protein